jgi:transcriptional regulator with XRE-family HTH domain
MKKEIPLDMKISRERSGLSGTDLAHLLNCNKERISKLEHGKARVTAHEMRCLCLIYGKTIDDVFHKTIKQLTDMLKTQLSDMPTEPANWRRKSIDRTDTLNGLTYRLQHLSKIQYEA